MLQAEWPVETAASQAEQQIIKALAQARRGDQAAFAELVRAHQSMVYSVARHVLREQAVAEEMAQEVFLHLYQHLAAIESPAHLKHWLRKVTSHRCIDYLRRNRLPSVELDAIAEPAVRATSGDLLLRQTLQRFVATLPATPRLIVTLRYQEDLDPTEIAQVLEMPVNTVKSHLRRALVMLREKVSRTLGDDVLCRTL